MKVLAMQVAMATLVATPALADVGRDAAGAPGAAGTPRTAWLPPLRSVPRSDTFHYLHTTGKRHYFRAVLEELALLGLGSAHYFANQDANSADWDLGYDWPSFRQKLDGRAYALDTNHFETNFLSHPGSGTLYYVAARGNRLGPLASLGYATAASTLWELVGEFRERMSVNDMIVTPMAGFVLGETLTQLGGFFDRSCEGTANRVLGDVFGFSKSVHDAADGLTPLRDVDCDAYGLSRSGDHRFRVSLAETSTWQQQGATRGAFLETRAGVGLSVVNVPTLGLPGTGFRTFSDGNLARVDASVTGGRYGWTDVRLAARVVPAGVHYRNLLPAPHGRSGHEVLFGVLVGVEYGSHRYSRGTADTDQVFFLDAPGMSVTLRLHGGERVLELGLDAGPTLAGIEAFALRDYRRTRPVDALPTIASTKGYDYAAGAMLEPSARLRTREVDLQLGLRAHRVWGIRALDRYRASPSPVRVQEGRREIVARLGLHPWELPVEVFVGGEARRRFGSLDDVSTSRSELTLTGGLGGVL